MVGEGEGGQGEWFVYVGRVILWLVLGWCWYGPCLSMWAARASRSMGGPSSLSVGRNCICLCAWLAPLRSPPSRASRQDRETIGSGESQGRGERPCTHNCRRRIGAFLPSALYEGVDTPGRGHWGVKVTSGSGILLRFERHSTIA
jgi:hypothetical protein